MLLENLDCKKSPKFDLYIWGMELVDRSDDTIDRWEVVYTIGTSEDCYGKNFILGVFDNSFEAELCKQEHQNIHCKDFSTTPGTPNYRNTSYNIWHYSPGTLAFLTEFRWSRRLGEHYPNLDHLTHVRNDRIIQDYLSKESTLNYLIQPTGHGRLWAKYSRIREHIEAYDSETQKYILN